MKKLYNIVIALFFIPIALNATEIDKFKHEKSKTIKKEFTVNADALMKINNQYGNVDVTSWDGNKIVIDVKITVSGNDEDKVIKRLDMINVEFESSSSEVSAKTVIQKKSSVWSWNWGKKNDVNYHIDYKIKVPITNNVSLNNDYGNISLNGTIYNVSGLGYHDHVWAPMNLKNLKFINSENIKNWKENNKFNLLNLWDWLCIHFDNGWDMFVGKIYSNKNAPGSNFGPGYLCFTPSGKKLYESYFFSLDYTETKNSTIPDVKIPIKIHIKALIFNTIGMYQFKGPILFDFYYEAINIQEELFGSSPNWGIWQSQGKINGYVKNLGKTTPLDGWAIMETTDNLNK